jgi:type IV pilus assembly protein PilB
MTKEDLKVKSILLKSKKIPQEVLEEIKKEAKKTQKPLLQILQEKKILSKKEALALKAKILGVPFVDLSRRKIPKKTLYLLSQTLAQKYQAVVFGKSKNKVRVAMVDPQDFVALEFIQKKLGCEVQPYLAAPGDIATALLGYSGLEVEAQKAISEASGEYVVPEFKKQEKMPTLEELIAEDTPIAKLVTSIIERAVKDRASDIHIEPAKDKIIVRYRIDGVLVKKLVLPKNIHAAVVSRIKVLSNLKIDETRVPQDGRFRSNFTGKEVDFRVSTIPTVHGEKVVLRILDTEVGLVDLEKVGFDQRGYEIVLRNIQKPHGIILVCGPTGSGKTTTLYAVLRKLNQEGVNIITLEDPVEYQIEGINQCQIRPNVGFTFASGLRSILRQDPDIIMVGEIRDGETAEMAVHAALTGHLVLSTLHTNDAAGAIPRLIDMGVEPFLIASVLNLVISQRLVRHLCQDCSQEFQAPTEISQEIKKEYEKMPDYIKQQVQLKEPLMLKKPVGCPHCDYVGYKGRLGIFEIMENSETIQKLTLNKASGDDILNQALREGMLTLKQDGLLKVLAGKTTFEEILRVTEE